MAVRYTEYVSYIVIGGFDGKYRLLAANWSLLLFFDTPGRCDAGVTS
jgi:hypothetical protein